MFSLPRKLTRRSKKKSLSYENSIVSCEGRGGSTASLPTLLGPRSYTSTSNYSNASSYEPPAFNSRMDPDAPLQYSPLQFSPLQYSPPPTHIMHHNHREKKRRNKELPTPPSRPVTFYSFIGSAIDSTVGRRWERSPSRQDLTESTTSPIALPHKALALLGIKEQSGFGTPPSPITIDNSDLMFDDHEIIQDYNIKNKSKINNTDFGREGLGQAPQRQNSWRGSAHRLIKTPQWPTPEIDVSPNNDKREVGFSPTPEKLYFRPQSLCSSFSANSEHTSATTVTTMTATSPSIESVSSNPKENGTLNSQSTIREISMLNLDDSDSEPETLSQTTTIYNTKRKMKSVHGTPERDFRTGELPEEISQKICSYFSCETHHDDLPENLQSEICPNCAIYALWSLSLTSRAWSKVAIVTLYRTISLDFGYYTLPTRAPDGKGIPPKFVPYSRCEEHKNLEVEAKLPLLYRTIWDSGGPVGDKILGLKLPRRLFSVTKYPLSAILQKCPNIEFVDHAVCTGSADELLPTLSGLKKTKRWTWKREQGVKYEQTKIRQKRMTAMVELKKTMPGPPQEVALHVLPLWTTLAHLELNNLRRFEIPDSFDFAVLPALRSMALKNLSIVDRCEGTRFLARLPALEKLEIDTCLFITPARIVHYLTHADRGHALKSLTLRDTNLTTADLYTVLPHCFVLRDLTVMSSSLEPTPSPVDAGELRLAEMDALRYVDVDIRPLTESFRFMLDVVDAANGLRRVRVGRRPEPKLVLEEFKRMAVRLQMGCNFAGVDLIM